MARKGIFPEKWKTGGPYSPAVLLDEKVLYVSGQLGLDFSSGKLVNTTFEEEFKQALKNLKAILEEAGTSLAHLVKVTLYLTSLEDLASANKIYAETIQADPMPARSAIVVSALPLHARIEIEAVAEIPG